MNQPPQPKRSSKKRAAPRKQPGMLVGVGLDDPEGHVRVTKGPDFRLYGGSKTTHAQMQELTMKSRERLKKRGKTFRDASGHHVREAIARVADDMGLQRPSEESA